MLLNNNLEKLNDDFEKEFNLLDLIAPNKVYILKKLCWVLWGQDG